MTPHPTRAGSNAVAQERHLKHACPTGLCARLRSVSRERVPAPLLVVTAIACVQTGAAIARTLFDDLGVAGTALLRLVIAAVVLLRGAATLGAVVDASAVGSCGPARVRPRRA